MPDTVSNSFRLALTENRVRRQDAAGEVRAARDELARLLAAGVVQGVPISTMARLAGVSRETAHKILRTVQKGDTHA